MPGVAPAGQQVAQHDEDCDDDRRRPASGLGFENDGDGANDQPDAPGELDKRDPRKATSDRTGEATDEVPRDGPYRPEQVEADVAVAEASEALGDERCDLLSGEVAGAVGVHDVATQKELAASGGGNRLPVADDPQADAAGLKSIGGDPPSDGQPGRLGRGRAAGAIQDPDGGVLPKTSCEQRTKRDANDGERKAEGDRQSSHDREPEQGADENVRDHDSGLEKQRTGRRSRGSWSDGVSHRGSPGSSKSDGRSSSQ